MDRVAIYRLFPLRNNLCKSCFLNGTFVDIFDVFCYNY